MHTSSSRRLSRQLAISIAAAAACASGIHAQTPVSYTGPANGQWSTPANWSTGIVPNNTLADQYAVNLGATPVSFLLPTGATITDLASTGSLSITDGTLTVERDVTGTGLITVAGGNSAFTMTTLRAGAVNPRVAVSAGGQSTLNWASYSTQSYNFNTTLFSSDGTGSTLNLSSLNSLNYAADNGIRNYTISATNNGVVNLSGLVSLSRLRPSDSALLRETLTFATSGGGSINLSALQSINNDTQGNFGFAQTRFNIATGGVMNLPALQNFRVGELIMANGSTFNAPLLTNIDSSILSIVPGITLVTGQLSQIDNARLSVSGGATYGSQVTDTTYNTGALTFNTTLFSADGTGSNLNLSSLNSLNYSADNGIRNYTISATNNGVVNLSGLVSLSRLRPSDGAVLRETLTFSTSDGGSINLSALQSINNDTQGSYGFAQTRFPVGSQTLTLPALTTARATQFTVGSGGVVNTPVLQSLTLGNELILSTGSTFNAPQLNNINGTLLSLTPGATLVTGQLSQIDNARLSVSGGATFGSQITDTTYNTGDLTFSTALFSADGTGSNLNLSSLNSLNYSADNGIRNFTISATNNGVVNLSGLVSLSRLRSDGAALRETLTFTASGGGSINLSALQSINNDTQGSYGFTQTRFPVGSQTLTLPALANARLTQFTVSNGGIVNAPALKDLNFFNELNLATGSTFNAPLLTSVYGLGLSIVPGVNLITGQLSQIDNARLSVSGGATYGSQITDTTYNTNDLGFSTTLFAADGSNSVLNLSVLNSLSYAADNGIRTFTISATDNGVVDLSGLISLSRLRSDGALLRDSLIFSASGGGSINLSGLQSINNDTGGNNGFTQTRFTAASGGLIRLGNLGTARYTQINVNDSTGQFIASGSLNLGTGSTMSLAANSTIEIQGSFSHTLTTEANFAATTASLKMTGLNSPLLEIAGTDLGATNPANSGNFGFGQLIVGTDTQATTLTLQDNIDNGNRLNSGTTPEALYLFGLGGPQGLVLKSGSVLVINNLSAYTRENGVWVSLQGLFPPGQSIVPYTFGGSNGFVAKSQQSLNILWTGATGGSWDTDNNWDLLTTPTAPFSTFITPSGGQTVFGPAGDATVRSLSIDGAGGITNFVLTGPGTLNVNGGLTVGTNGNLQLLGGTANASALINTGTVQQFSGTTANYATVFNQGSLTSNGSLTVTGTMTNNSTYVQAGGIAALANLEGTGSTTINAAAVATAARVRQGALTVQGLLTINENGTSAATSRLSSLTIGEAGIFNLTNNDLLLNYTDTSPIQTLIAYLQSGQLLPNGDLNGLPTTLAITEAADLGLTTFNGLPVDDTTVIAKYTYVGDANLDGQVDALDYERIDLAIGNTGVVGTAQGDLNYDGNVDALDYEQVDLNIGNGVGSPLSPVFIPEPALLAPLALASLALRRRRA
jgi:hypothetical protein